MTEERTYTGGCHCGNVQYEVTGNIAEVLECNCSICSKTGALWTFVPAQQFRLTAGADRLSDYQFGKKRIHHTFCPSCGIRSFARGLDPGGHEVVAVNVRCVENLDVAGLPVRAFDGRSL